MERKYVHLPKADQQGLGGPPSSREIKRYQGVVDLINELEDEMSTLTDEELREKTREFRSASD